ncbi:unnamed protein product, partial [Iphiclides podalirius]
MLLLSVFLAILAVCQCKVEFSDRARNFSVELLYYTAEETHWHTVISPLGVWSLLTGISTGATGNSKAQLRRSLLLPKRTTTVVEGHKKLMSDVVLPKTKDVTLKSVNYLFVDTGFVINPVFHNSIVYDFGAKVTRLRFSSPDDAAAKANGVIQKSGATVSNVLRSDDFQNSRVILTNVITFKGLWRLPFNESETKVLPFHDEKMNEIGKVNMMQQQENFQFSNIASISATVLELPYGEDDHYSFLVILPYLDVTLAEVYTALERVSVKEILEKLRRDTEEYGEASVIVNLPRFKISTNVVLNRPLYNMGVIDIFDPQAASFKQISNTESLHVSAIVHKADIEVTETGTIASAATSAYFADRALPANFNANRPFLYFVVEKSTATIIFSGVYSKPTVF